MTQVLPRSVLVLLASSALCACATPRYPVSLAELQAAGTPPAAAPAASREPAFEAGGSAVLANARAPAPVGESALPNLQPAVDDGAGERPELILAAVHRRHHARASVHHREIRKAEPAGAPGASGKVVEEESGGTYKVRSGDSLEKIADKLGTSVAELKKINRLKGSLIHPGQVLKGPRKTSHVYVVHSGDRLVDVAKRFGVTEAAIRSENGLSRHATRLRAGEKLKLPEGYRDHATPAPQRESSRARGSETAPASDEAAEISSGVIGRVVEAEGPPRTYRVRKGDTLEKVADRLGTSVAQLKKDNHLRKSLIHPGQVLKGPRTRAKAYVVGPGDTIYAIARRFGVSVQALRAANGMSSRHSSIHTGQKLRLPAGYHDRGPERPVERTPERAPERPSVPPPRQAAPSETPSREATPPSSPQPYTPPARPYTPPPQAALPTPSPAPSDAQITQLGRGRFIWPVTGDIVSDFGPKSVGQRNDGINIRANLGDPVRAAAAGDVVYAGDQVPGFGNLVLIKHADGWVTAYAHLSRVDVKMQQKVQQGQQIGLAGQTGGVSEPQLHFEVRYAPTPTERARPVDPKLVLPQP